MSKLSQLQNNLTSYLQAKKQIIANKNSYTTTRTYTVLAPESFEKIEIPYAEVDHLFLRDPRDPGTPGSLFNAFSCPQSSAQLQQFLVNKIGNNAIKVPNQGALRFGDHILYFLNDQGQQGHVQGHWHNGVQWTGIIKLYYYVQKQETRSEQVFNQAGYNTALSNAQWYVDKTQKELNTENSRLALIKQQQQQALIVKQQQEALIAKQQKEEKVIVDKITSMDIQERALFVSQIFDNKDANSIFTINKIKDLGLDTNYLAHIAIQKNNLSLIKLSLVNDAAYTANYTDYIIEGKTLLQHLFFYIKEGLAEDLLVKETILKCKDLSITAISAIKQDDMLSITKLFFYDNNFLKQKYNGHTLLQIAIKENLSISIINKLLELDTDCSTILADNGKSALQIACQLGKEEAIQILIQHVNIDQELEQLDPDINTKFKAKILEQNDIDILVKLLKGEEVSIEEYLGIEEVMEEKEDNINIYGVFDYGDLNAEVELIASVVEDNPYL